MKILVDLVHPADVNFYKNPIAQWKKKHTVVLTVMDRRGLLDLVNKELGEAHVVGVHQRSTSFASKALASAQRVWKLRRVIKKLKPDVVTSFSFYPAAAVKGLGIPDVIFHDDPEYSFQFTLCQKFASKLIVPKMVKGGVAKNYFKEWSYMDPRYFVPSAKPVKSLGLVKNKYIFVRDVETSSLNYKEDSGFDYSSFIALCSKKKWKVVVSSEDPSRRFPGAIVLDKPIDDFHSLVYYARGLVSSGDTMIREAAMVGVPAVYTGKRDMAVNNFLEKKNRLIRASTPQQAIEYCKKRQKPMVLPDTVKMIVHEVENAR